MTPRPYDLAVAKFIAWLKRYGLTAHVNLDGNVRLAKRVPRRSRLTGEVR